MKIPFTKMSGAGNDFIVIDNRNGIIKNPVEFTVTSCNRRLGIGADGVLFVENSEIADFKMHYFNADGSDGGMCGNGGRCIAKFAYDVGIVIENEFTFEALGYIYGARRIEEKNFELNMKNPVNLKIDSEITIGTLQLYTNFIDTGSPHCVIFLDENKRLGDLESVNVFELGREIRNHNIFQPKGANVNFVKVTSDNSIKIRTYERGVEEETLACGTGSIASAIISSFKYKSKTPVKVEVQSGESLFVNFNALNADITKVKLTGPAETIFVGELELRI
jgi:diaminopimelate epimerase